MNDRFPTLGGRPRSSGPWRQPVGLNPARIGGEQAYVHRFRIGIFDAAIVSDGPLILPAAGEVFRAVPAPALEAMLDAEFLPGGPLRVEQNVLLLDVGGHLVVFDTGMGSSTLFGPQAGRLPRSLGEVGLAPEQIDALVFSHAHPDHCWGTMREDGTPVFPNAQIYISEPELRFWEDCTEQRLELSVEGVRRHLLPLRDRISFFRDGEEFLPGIHALFAPGHTPGHTAFVIASAEEEVCVLADVAFHHVVSFADPGTPSAYDQDQGLGAETRTHLLGRLAEERMKIVGYHLPWPGLGHVARRGPGPRDGFRYVPAPMLFGLTP